MAFPNQKQEVLLGSAEFDAVDVVHHTFQDEAVKVLEPGYIL
jgi:hypothetical protein